MNGRVYARKFDWAEAQRLRDGGMTYSAIARRLGVSITAVRLAVDAEARLTARERSAAGQRSGTCIDCGAQCSHNPSQPVKRCRKCNAVVQTTTVRAAELQCVTCKAWKPDAEFAHDRRRPHRRGRHRQCRPCTTAAKRAWRAKRAAA